jgi:hypothetical protein
MENRHKQDGIRSTQYATESNHTVRIKKLENIIATFYSRHYREGLFKWIQYYEETFNELVLLGAEKRDDISSKKHRFDQNAQNIGMVDTVFEELVRIMSNIEACNFLRSQAVHNDQQNKIKAARHLIATSQSSSPIKKKKPKQILSPISELQIQDSTVLEGEVEIPPASKIAMVCKLAQVQPVFH